MGIIKSTQINQLLTFLEGMERTKSQLRSWRNDSREVEEIEESLILGYELVAMYGPVKTQHGLANMAFLQRRFIANNVTLLPVEMYLSTLKGTL